MLSCEQANWLFLLRLNSHLRFIIPIVHYTQDATNSESRKTIPVEQLWELLLHQKLYLYCIRVSTFEIHFKSLYCWLQWFPSIWTALSMSSSERGRFSAWALRVNDVPTWALASHQLKSARSLSCYSAKHITGDLTAVLKQTTMNGCSLFCSSGFDIHLLFIFLLSLAFFIRDLSLHQSFSCPLGSRICGKDVGRTSNIWLQVFNYTCYIEYFL